METQDTTLTRQRRRIKLPERYSKKNRFIWLAFGIAIGIILCQAFETINEITGSFAFLK